MQPCLFSPTHIYYGALQHSSAISTSINHSHCYRKSLSPPVCIPCGFLKRVGMLGEKTCLTKLLGINLLSQRALKQCIHKLLVTAKRCTQHMAHCFNESIWLLVKEAWPLACMQTCTFRGEMHVTGSRVLVGYYHPGTYFCKIKEYIFFWLITSPELEDTFIQSDVQGHLLQGRSHWSKLEVAFLAR